MTIPSGEVPPARCPYCQSETRQVRAGTNSGVQRYKCGVCQRRYTPQASGSGYTDAVRAQAAELRAQGKTVREIARSLGVNHQSVANWLRKPVAEVADATDALPVAHTGKQRPTIRDVARHANVSPASVSNYLNQKGRMAAVTGERIQAAMQELHFTPSALVRALKRRRTGILGVMLQSLGGLDETEGPGGFLIPALLRGINDEANAAGNDLLLYTGGRHDRRDDLEARFLGGHVDGLIWMTPERQAPVLEQIVAAGLPVVALMTHEVPSGVSFVTSDNHGGIRQLVEHLALLGHRRIAFVGPNKITDFRDRHQGFRQAMAAQGLPWEAALQVAIGRRDSGPEGCDRILTTWLALPNPPTAILCGNDHTAARFADALRQRGLRLPDDMALAGFDDLPIAEHVAGGLTTIRQPFRQMGQLAAEQLLALVDGKTDAVFHTVLPTHIVVRKSTDKTVPGDAR